MMNDFNNRGNANSFNDKCFTCNRFGHVDNKCRSRGNQVNEKKIVVCFNCNRFGHIARFCRSRNDDRKGPVNRNKNVQRQDKGKGKADVNEI